MLKGKLIDQLRRQCSVKRLLMIIVSALLVVYGVKYTRVYKRAYEAWTAPCDLRYINDETYSDTKAKNLKVIYGASLCFGAWQDKFSFSDCTYNNCVVESCPRFTHIERADVVLYSYAHITIPDLFETPAVVINLPELSAHDRVKQSWLLVTHEAPAWSFDKFLSSLVDNKFNGAMTFRRDSLVYLPYYRFEGHKAQSSKNYAEGKTKGAFAYVSNCDSNNYNRLGLMKELSQYVDVDIFGKCTGIYPCSYADFDCEAKLHKQYHFFLSFENSLCQDYITEKFWVRLTSTSHFLPVVIGGLSTDDYSRVAPPNSFLHVYNFTSVEALGKYMKELMNNKEKYNKYHEWRHTDLPESQYPKASCRLCEIANKKPVPIVEKLAHWWNDESKCRKYDY